MNLQCIHEGRLTVTCYRTVYEEQTDDRFRAVGRLPDPATGRARLTYRLKTTTPWKAALERLVGRFPTVNIWRISGEALVGSAVRWLFCSTDGGRTWLVTARLPDSSGPMGILPTALCEHEGTLYAGEYPLAEGATPRVLRSVDMGRTWEPLLSMPDVRHVHAIKPDPYSGNLWMTTGDAGEECRIGRLRDGRFDVVGGGEQRWRAVEPVFTPAGMLWGVDSVYMDTNPIYLLPREEMGAENPDIEQLTAVDSSVYYGVSLDLDDHWVVFSTAFEPGADSTAPPEQRVVRTGNATVLAASSATGYTRWHEIASYDKQSVWSDRRPVADLLPAANAYVYLVADDERGLFTNPFNTARHDGTIRQYRPAFFEGLR